jgi:hypothetical protein
MSVSGTSRKWRKATASQPSEHCVEVALDVDEVGVRDTKDRQGGHIDVSARAWQAVIDTLRQA